jgi:galactokinase/mevalonate kinase-like predicted kinase
MTVDLVVTLAVNFSFSKGLNLELYGDVTAITGLVSGSTCTVVIALLLLVASDTVTVNLDVVSIARLPAVMNRYGVAVVRGSMRKLHVEFTVGRSRTQDQENTRPAEDRKFGAASSS